MNRQWVVRSQSDRFSVRASTRLLATGTGLSLLLLASALFSLSVGSYPTQPGDLINLVFGAVDDPGLELIFHEIRMPRVLMGILVGASLGIAGLVLQGMVGNPLASPDVIGISHGAAAAAVLALWLTGSAGDTPWMVPAAMAGALLVAVVLVALVWRVGIRPARLVLIGIGLAAGLSALTTLLLVLSPDATAMTAYVWLTGSLYAARWNEVWQLAPITIAAVAVILLNARHLDLHSLGADMAQGLGSRITRMRLLFLLAAVILTGSAVAYAGALGFVGLIAPHLARQLVRAGHAGMVWLSGLTGALLLVWADVIGRTLFLPRDMPAGIFIAGLGAPFLLYLLYRLKRRPG